MEVIKKGMYIAIIGIGILSMFLAEIYLWVSNNLDHFKMFIMTSGIIVGTGIVILLIENYNERKMKKIDEEQTVLKEISSLTNETNKTELLKKIIE